MLVSAVSVLVVAQSSSEFPEGLMNNPVLEEIIMRGHSRLSVLFFKFRNHLNIVQCNPIFDMNSEIYRGHMSPKSVGTLSAHGASEST